MSLQRKSRFGAALLIIGSVLAAVGEIINAPNMDVLGSSWHLSLGLIISGTFILLIGLLPFAATSAQINGLGFWGCVLLVLGGLLLIIGTATLDWIILPFLVNLGNALAAAINGPAIETQNALNSIIANLNGLGGSILKGILPGSISQIAPVHIPVVNGMDLVNKILVQLHLPAYEKLLWWGHFSLSGGSLILGGLIVGIALLRRARQLAVPGVLLIVFTLLNLLSQFVSVIPLSIGNITAAGLFLTLAWLGLSEWIQAPGAFLG
jgi:hypothetical protein